MATETPNEDKKVISLARLVEYDVLMKQSIADVVNEMDTKINGVSDQINNADIQNFDCGTWD